jgi:hypothetical protein
MSSTNFFETFVNWLKRNALLAACIILPFIIGGYLWGKSVEDDYKARPAFDDSERRWGIVEAYGGGAILFGSIGALVYYVGLAIVKKG